ncbi:MAG: type II secretion system protein, partial [Planctomycetes bacterium]|nr:type II secretion system protein [Planctomycetota bacterium]
MMRAEFTTAELQINSSHILMSVRMLIQLRFCCSVSFVSESERLMKRRGFTLIELLVV